MIKLKVTRSDLQVLTTCTNPRLIEDRILSEIKLNRVFTLDYLFVLMDLGEKLTKKFYFSNQKQSRISLKYAEGAALLTHITELEAGNWDLFTKNVLQSTKSHLHGSLTNYQRRIL